MFCSKQGENISLKRQLYPRFINSSGELFFLECKHLYSRKEGQKPENRNKNRYKNILPCKFDTDFDSSSESQ